MTHQILEGTWEEISCHASELSGRRVRLTVLSDQENREPNEVMLAAMQRIAKRNQDKPLTSSKTTQDLLRQARDGGMFGYGSKE